MMLRLPLEPRGAPSVPPKAVLARQPAVAVGQVEVHLGISSLRPVGLAIQTSARVEPISKRSRHGDGSSWSRFMRQSGVNSTEPDH
jgi:hypothetical protein